MAPEPQLERSADGPLLPWWFFCERKADRKEESTDQDKGKEKGKHAAVPRVISVSCCAWAS